MKSRIMYIECKGNEISGPARIGRVTFSKSGKSLYYQGRRFHTLSGGGFKANYFDWETGEHYCSPSPVLLAESLPGCVVWCIQLACVTNHASTGSSVRLRLLKRKDSPPWPE